MRYPIPDNDSDFEVFCMKFLRVHWKCPSLDLYAHRGEEQFGIDILDPGGNEPLRAAQCKLHDPWKAILPAEIRSEVKKAEKFNPALGFYSILTSAKSSREAQNEVLKINKEHRNRRLFPIELMTWGKIEQLLDGYDDIREDLLSTLSGRTATEIKNKLSAIHDAVVSKPSRERSQHEASLPIPKADPNRFSVALAHLTHDNGQEVERLIIESVRNVAADLTPFVEKVRNLLESNQAAQRWTAGAAAEVMFILARALQQLGEQSGQRNYLIQSVHYNREIVGKGILSEIPAYEFAVPNNFGVALGTLGTLESDTSHLLEAVTILRDALNRVVLRDHLPIAWANLQTNLGNALVTLGIRQSETENLRQAENAHRAALRVWTRERFPLDWATVQNNLGYALRLAGDRERGNELLFGSITCHRSALEEWTRDQVPNVLGAGAKQSRKCLAESRREATRH